MSMDNRKYGQIEQNSKTSYKQALRACPAGLASRTLNARKRPKGLDFKTSLMLLKHFCNFKRSISSIRVALDGPKMSS